jgi:hypothetical protein
MRLSKKAVTTMQAHSFVIVWWATIEVLLGRGARQTQHLKNIVRMDWTYQEGVMAELLCTCDKTSFADLAAQGFGPHQGGS